MSEWWEAVKENRKNPGGSSTALEEVPQTENELAKGFR